MGRRRMEFGTCYRLPGTLDTSFTNSKPCTLPCADLQYCKYDETLRPHLAEIRFIYRDFGIAVVRFFFAALAPRGR